MSIPSQNPALDELGYLLAEAPGNVVFVVGAGLSRPAGLPSWEGLLQVLDREARQFVAETDRLSSDQKKEEIERLDSIRDPWLLGDQLQSLLPRDRYHRTVRHALTTDQLSPAYGLLWSLRPAGMISFNLDKLAERALNGAADQVASAFERAKFPRFLLLSRPFLLQPHGQLNHWPSWVLGASSRNKLLKANQEYRRFIVSCLSSTRLVILGFKPKDLAFESLLLDDFRYHDPKQEQGGLDHFWITESLSPEDRIWAREYHIKPIEYEPSSDSHPEILEILKHLQGYEPREPEAPLAYEGQTISLDDLPEDGRLRSESVESIRRKLNAALAGVAKQAGSDHEMELEEIARVYRQYSGSVHMAWHVLSDSQYSRLWGYSLIKPLGDGAFGNVWLAEDPVDGRRVAVKVLRENLLRDAHFLEAFRRGINAMKILHRRGVEGMVRMDRAYDIPACIFMEYIEGSTLSDALKQGAFGDISEVLTVLRKVAGIIRDAHGLRERVLHRDLKPTNIMLRNLWDPDHETEVIVLDFDLSWYEGALGLSMVPRKAFNNYIAPEQLMMEGRRRYNSRHTAVDVFGLGMLLYFLSTGDEPAVNVQRKAGFFEDVRHRIEERWSLTFVSIARSLADLIEKSTYDEQPMRLSLPAFIKRLDVLLHALESHVIDLPSDLALVEVTERLARTLPDDVWKVEWQRVEFGESRIASLASGVRINLGSSGSKEGRDFTCEIVYDETGETKRSHVSKYLAKASERAAARVRRNRLLKLRGKSSGAGSSGLEIEFAKDRLSAEELNDVAETLSEAARILSLQ